MLNKITAIVNLIATVQVTHESDICSISVEIIEFALKTQEECFKAKEYITSQFKCQYKVGDGYSTSVDLCDAKLVNAKFNHVCAELKGANSTSSDSKPGACVPSEVHDEEEYFPHPFLSN